MKAEPCEVLATWQRLHLDRAANAANWIDRYPNAAPERLRASLGPRRLTVWLPSGARVSCGLARFTGDPKAETYVHHYAEAKANGGDRLRIVFAFPKPEPARPLPAGVDPFEQWCRDAGLIP